MAYYLDLFSPQTYEAFKRSSRDVTGFRERHRVQATRIGPGDVFLCYVTKLSRWWGILDVDSSSFRDERPIFQATDDPFVVRFNVKPRVVLDIEHAIPIHDDDLWKTLSFTREHDKRSSTWTGKLRGSLVAIDEADGQLIEQALLQQTTSPRVYPVDHDEYRRMQGMTVRRAERDVVVTVPEDTDVDVESLTPSPEYVTRESHQIQALLGSIGARMGMKVWIPRNDRQAVLGESIIDETALLERLPLNYDDTTLNTIERIDVLWIRGRSIVRAFEIEHTTSVYSGILRMADLLALQPNMEIRLHIVGPVARREKVFSEITRPVFSLLESGPLSDTCTFIPYDAVRDIASLPRLEHMRDQVVDDYAENAQESDI